MQGLRRLRRQAALQRAVSTTIGPAASASAETLGTWLHDARDGLQVLTNAIHARRPAPALRRLAALPEPQSSGVRVHVAELRDANGYLLSRRLGGSPLARLGPPRQPRALPAPAAMDDVADQPTTLLTLDALRASARPAVNGPIVDAAAQPPTLSHQAASSARDAQSGALAAEAQAEAQAPVQPGADAGESGRAPAPAAPLAPTQRLRRRPAASDTVGHEELPATRRLPKLPRPPAGSEPDEEPAASLGALESDAAAPPARAAATIPLADSDELLAPAAQATTGPAGRVDATLTPAQAASVPAQPARRYRTRRWRRLPPRRKRGSRRQG